MAAVTTSTAGLTDGLLSAGDELFGALDAFPGGELETALDELIYLQFDPTQVPPDRGVDPVLLAAARERLYTAGREWAAAVTTSHVIAQVA